ncbi:MFS transporter [Luteimonas sp. TWI1416]|uniref:MFS transporter n=1 Tax=unclassified Luteimonas TaxID=2629088 RepID=UPI00320814B4
MAATRDRLALSLVVGAGIVSAFQVGKATLALESIRLDLGVDLSAASWVLSAFAMVGALVSVLVGAVSDRIQARPTVVAGLLLQAVGSALGAMAPGLGLLLAARALEGLGFLAVTVAAPVLVVAATSPATRKQAFAAWAMFMPLGMALVLFAAPGLATLGWRGLWWANAALLAVYALVLVSGTRDLPPTEGQGEGRHWQHGLRRVLEDRGAWWLAGQFCAYTAMFFALFGFLPTLLGERLGVGGSTAGMLSALAVLAGAAGCLAGGMLLQRGLDAPRILRASFATLALCSLGILALPLPGELAYLLCVLFSFVGAFIPVAIFDAAPRLARRPGTLGSIVGLATQGNNVGIVIGPVLAAGVASAGSWHWVALPLVLIALLAMHATPAGRHPLAPGQ